MVMRHISIAIAICGVALVGCSPTRPDPAGIFVTTAPSGASCTLSRDGQPIGNVSPTPGIALVTRTPGEIAVDCRRSGFRDAAAIVSPRLGDSSLFQAGRYEYNNPPILTLTPLR
jgi:hypothetical protein